MRFIEIFGGVGKLRREFRHEFSAHFITARADGRAEGRQQILRPASELEPHTADGFFRDAAERATPSRVNGGDGAPFWINQKNWNTVGGLYRQKNSRAIGDRGIPLAGIRGGLAKVMDDVGMDLFHGRKGQPPCTKGILKPPAIFHDIFPLVPFQETEVEYFSSIEFTRAALARAETMHQPRQVAKRPKLENL